MKALDENELDFVLSFAILKIHFIENYLGIDILMFSCTQFTAHKQRVKIQPRTLNYRLWVFVFSSFVEIGNS